MQPIQLPFLRVTVHRMAHIQFLTTSYQNMTELQGLEIPSAFLHLITTHRSHTFRHLNRVLRSEYVTEFNKCLALYLYDYGHVTQNEGNGSLSFEIMSRIRHTNTSETGGNVSFCRLQ